MAWQDSTVLVKRCWRAMPSDCGHCKDKQRFLMQCHQDQNVQRNLFHIFMEKCYKITLNIIICLIVIMSDHGRFIWMRGSTPWSCSVDDTVIIECVSSHSPQTSLKWRHNERNGVSNHQPRDCLLDGLFRQIKENIKASRQWPLWGEFTGEFPTQRASNAENVSIWWCHHVLLQQRPAAYPDRFRQTMQTVWETNGAKVRFILGISNVKRSLVPNTKVVYRLVCTYES